LKEVKHQNELDNDAMKSFEHQLQKQSEQISELTNQRKRIFEFV
jgi:hypothetical protein